MSILDRIRKPGFRHRAVEFERLALSLLRADALSTDKQLFIGPEAGVRFRYADAIAPSGYAELPGICLVEAKYTHSIENLIFALRRFRKPIPEVKSVLVVTNLSSKDVREAEKAARGLLKIPHRILGEREIETLAKKYPAVALSYDISFFDEAVESFGKSDVDSQTSSKMSALQSAFKEDQLVLFLGAGVSLSANLPDWPQLLNRLALDLLKTHPDVARTQKESKELLSYFRSNAPTSPLITARLLSDSVQDFPQKVRTALYTDYGNKNASPLIQQLARLCVPGRANQGLAAVVTYNFDDLLESELTRLSINYHVVIAEEDSPTREELPVYHPHGFLPREGEIAAIHENALVLSEDAYHNQFIDPYSWPNITQLNLLRNHVCLFVGLSMTDPNLRRLLEIAQIKKPGARHYVILKDNWTPTAKKRASKTLRVIGRVFRGLEETSLSRLGISVIWVQKHSQIASIISTIKPD
jgi:hypothetical protein